MKKFIADSSEKLLIASGVTPSSLAISINLSSSTVSLFSMLEMVCWLTPMVHSQGFLLHSTKFPDAADVASYVFCFGCCVHSDTFWLYIFVGKKTIPLGRCYWFGTAGTVWNLRHTFTKVSFFQICFTNQKPKMIKKTLLNPELNALLKEVSTVIKNNIVCYFKLVQ